MPPPKSCATDIASECHSFQNPLTTKNVVTLLDLELVLYCSSRVMFCHQSITFPIQWVNQEVRVAPKACYFRETLDQTAMKEDPGETNAES